MEDIAHPGDIMMRMSNMRGVEDGTILKREEGVLCTIGAAAILVEDPGGAIIANAYLQL